MEIILKESFCGFKFGESRAKVRLSVKGEWLQSASQNARLVHKDGKASLLFADGKFYCGVINELSVIERITINGLKLEHFDRKNLFSFFNDSLGLSLNDTAKGYGSRSAGIFFHGRDGDRFLSMEVHGLV